MTYFLFAVHDKRETVNVLAGCLAGWLADTRRPAREQEPYDVVSAAAILDFSLHPAVND